MSPSDQLFAVLESLEVTLKIISRLLLAATAFSALYFETTYIHAVTRRRRLTLRGRFEVTAIVTGLALFGLGEYVSKRKQDAKEAPGKAQVAALTTVKDQQASIIKSQEDLTKGQQAVIDAQATIGARARAMDLGRETLWALRAAWIGPALDETRASEFYMWKDLLKELESASVEQSPSISAWANTCSAQTSNCYITVRNGVIFEAGDVVARNGGPLTKAFSPEDYFDGSQARRPLSLTLPPMPRETVQRGHSPFPLLRLAAVGLQKPLVFTATYTGRYMVTLFRHHSSNPATTKFTAVYTLVDTGIRFDELEQGLELSGDAGTWVLKSLDAAVDFRKSVRLPDESSGVRLTLSPRFSSAIPALRRNQPSPAQRGAVGRQPPEARRR